MPVCRLGGPVSDAPLVFGMSALARASSVGKLLLAPMPCLLHASASAPWVGSATVPILRHRKCCFRVRREKTLRCTYMANEPLTAVQRARGPIYSLLDRIERCSQGRRLSKAPACTAAAAKIPGPELRGGEVAAVWDHENRAVGSLMLSRSSHRA